MADPSEVVEADPRPGVMSLLGGDSEDTPEGIDIRLTVSVGSRQYTIIVHTKISADDGLTVTRKTRVEEGWS